MVSLSARSGRMAWIAAIVTLFTIWTIRLASPPAATLLGPFRNYLDDHAPDLWPVASKAPEDLDLALYSDGERTIDQATGDIDLSDADAPFIIWPLKRVCTEQQDWVEGLVFVCDNNFGGVGNIRTFILTCVRYAIEAGATGLTMPRIQKRSDSNIGSLFEHNIQPFDYLFDAAHFRGALARSCPQISIYKDDYSDIPNAKNIKNIPRVNFIREKGAKELAEDSLDTTEPVPVHVISPKDFRCHYRTVEPAAKEASKRGEIEGGKTESSVKAVVKKWFGHEGHDGAALKQRSGEPRDNKPEEHAEAETEPKEEPDGRDGDCNEFFHNIERWGDNFREWAFDEKRVSKSGVPAPSAATPFLVRMGKWALFQFPTEKDGAEFRNTFGQLLKFKRPVMALGQKVLGKMHNMSAAMHAERRSVGLPTPNRTTVIHNDEGRGFLGLHLRTEADVTHAGWPGYDELEQGFLAKAAEHGFEDGAAYVATGNVDDARRFASEAREALNLTVVDKRMLLADEPEALAALDAMNWDQQGLVDFVVMAASEMFVGSSRSSFSIWLCERRGVAVDGGIHARPFRLRTEHDDGASWVVGSKKFYWADWLHFFDATWP